MQPENIATLQGNPIARLKDGQSVFIESSRDGMENTYRELKLKCLDYSTFHGGKFEVRKVVGGIRVWRLKPENAPARIERKKIAPPPPVSMETKLPRPKIDKKNKPEPIQPEPIPTKRCCHCKGVKNTSEFAKHKGNKDGLQDTCKVCSRAYCRAYYNKKRVAKYKAEVEAAIQTLQVRDEKAAAPPPEGHIYTLTQVDPTDKKRTRRVPVPYVKPEPEALSIWGRLKKIVGLR